MDRILDSWLERQHRDAIALAADSDSLAIRPHDARPPRDYIVHFGCLTLVRVDGEVKTWERGCAVLFRFPLDYLRVVRRPECIVSLLSPRDLYHPNVAPPFLCVGHIAPGTGLCELIYRVHELLTFAKLSPREDDALNRDACAWARANMQRFPLDRRPLKRRAATFAVHPITGSGT